MKLTKLLGASLCLCLLSACGGAVPSLPLAPETVAARTTLDERAMLAVEVSWRAAGAAIEAAVDSGLLKGDAALKVDRIDAQAGQWVGAMRAAYDAGNAQDFSTALAQAKALVGQLRDLLGIHTPTGGQ